MTVAGGAAHRLLRNGAMWPFGVHMVWGWSLVNAWPNDAASSGLYWGSPGQVMHGAWKSYGRPSTISVSWYW